jgi:microcystin-dependent protein
MPFQYTFRADDITTWDATTRDLIENRDRELELSLIALNGVNPIGGITMFGSASNIPANYLICNGASLSTSTYANLFNIIGYNYGGSGASFNLPNLTTRIPIGTASTPTTPTTQATSASSAVDVHTHTVNSTLTAGSVNSSFAAGNAADHVHPIVGNTGNASDTHQHTYFKPNTGANSSTGFSGSAHTHGILFNSSGSNTTISVNSSFTAGNTNSSLTAGNASTINASTLAHTHTLNTVQLVFIIRVE